MDEDDSPFSINVAHDCERASVDAAAIRDVIERTLRRFDRDRARISVALVGDLEIADLNERYLQHTGPTDCITFKLGDDPQVTDGEIVISWDTAARERPRLCNSVPTGPGSAPPS